MSCSEKDDKSSHSARWVACPIEEHYFGNDRKSSRIERKRLSTKDRSKFKKSDRKKFEQGMKKEIQDRLDDRQVFQGRVLSITSQGIIIDHEGESYTCFLRGLLKKEKTKSKNIVTVGDFVLFTKLPCQEGYITEVLPRKSTLSRADNLSRKKEQLIAANIDQVIITASVVSPPLKPFLIDRYIIAARKGNMDPVIVINKIDLIEDVPFEQQDIVQEVALLKECENAYKLAGIPLIKMSKDQKIGLNELENVMKGRASVFSGQSGTGKSSLINLIADLDLPVGETVQKTKKGAHTTTRAHLVPLPFGGWCIDTPGIKSFGVWDLSQKDIESYFDEIQQLSHLCKFPDCTHVHEGQCQVMTAYQNGTVSSLRYESYVALIESIQVEHRRR